MIEITHKGYPIALLKKVSGVNYCLLVGSSVWKKYSGFFDDISDIIFEHASDICSIEIDELTYNDLRANMTDGIIRKKEVKS